MDEAKTAGAAAEGDLAILCQSCGLCCDGSLFGRVDLAPEEVEPARRRGLRVFHDARGFEQPCAALASAGPGPGYRRCSIYDERPRACRRFVCRLYDRHRREGGPVEGRLRVVRRLRSLVRDLEASGLSPADFDAGPLPRAAESALQAYRELTRMLEDDFARMP
jgi:hypothetical protein